MRDGVEAAWMRLIVGSPNPPKRMGGATGQRRGPI
jgi:hypothetical protein